jgi:alcohol dehydrogenase class IV
MFGELSSLLLAPSSAALLRNQNVVLLTSAKGAKRRSHDFTLFLLRQKLHCTAFAELALEPSIVASANCERILRRTKANVLVALGGAYLCDVLFL